MSRVVFDASLISRLQPLSSLTEICDESGRTLGFYHPVQDAATQPQMRSPFSQEELNVLRRQRSGRALSEILDELGGT